MVACGIGNLLKPKTMKLGKYSDKTDPKFRLSDGKEAANFHFFKSEAAARSFAYKLKSNNAAATVCYGEIPNSHHFPLDLKFTASKDLGYYVYEIKTIVEEHQREAINLLIFKIIASLRFVFPPKYQEEIKGDLIEMVHKMLKENQSKGWVYVVVFVQLFSIFNHAWRCKLAEYFSTEKEKEVGR